MDDHMIEIHERLAILEEKAEQGGNDRAEIKRSQEGLHDDFIKLAETINDMRNDLAKYRGFWGGALLVVSAVWAFIELSGAWIVQKIKGEA